MACSEADQLLGAYFQAILDKVEVGILQLRRNVTENVPSRIKDTFTERL